MVFVRVFLSLPVAPSADYPEGSIGILAGTLMPTKFVSRKEVAHASVCRDVPPPSLQKHKQHRVSASSKYRISNLRVPEEYALALLEMYPGKKSVSSAILHHIKLTIKPLEIEE